jgi:hypothetical protein
VSVNFNAKPVFFEAISMKHFTSICIALTAMLLVAPVIAGEADLNPPSWRGNPGTSWADWEFLNNISSPSPNSGYLPYGAPLITVTPGTGAGWSADQPTSEGDTLPYWDPTYPQGYGWWNLSGEINVTMQDAQVNNPLKELWIQFIWEPQAPGNLPFVQMTSPAGDPTDIPLESTVLWQGDPDNPWREVVYDVFHIDLHPNPDQESIEIYGGVNVDGLTIDTWCVPEPATWVLLVTGAGCCLALNRCRKRA